MKTEQRGWLKKTVDDATAQVEAWPPGLRRANETKTPPHTDSQPRSDIQEGGSSGDDIGETDGHTATLNPQALRAN